MVCLGLEHGAAGRKAQTNPLSFSTTVRTVWAVVVVVCRYQGKLGTQIGRGRERSHFKGWINGCTISKRTRSTKVRILAGPVLISNNFRLIFTGLLTE